MPAVFKITIYVFKSSFIKIKSNKKIIKGGKVENINI